MVIMVKITKLETTAFSVPYIRALSISGASFEGTVHILVEVYTDEGITGIGEAHAIPPTARKLRKT